MLSQFLSNFYRARVRSGWSFRVIHRTLALYATLPLLGVAFTGVSYRFSRNVLGWEKQDCKWMLQWHEMSVIGLQATYPIMLSILACTVLTAGLFLSPIRSGIASIWKTHTKHTSAAVSNSILPTSSPSTTSSSTSSSRHRRTFSSSAPSFLERCSCRVFHRWLATILFVPLLCTFVTGGLYAVTKHWLLYEKETTSTILRIHQGSYFLDPVLYTLIVFTAVIVLISSGCTMTSYGSMVWSKIRPVDSAYQEERTRMAIANVASAFEITAMTRTASGSQIVDERRKREQEEEEDEEEDRQRLLGEIMETEHEHDTDAHE